MADKFAKIKVPTKAPDEQLVQFLKDNKTIPSSTLPTFPKSNYRDANCQNQLNEAHKFLTFGTISQRVGEKGKYKSR